MRSHDPFINRRRIAALGTSLAVFVVIAGLHVATARNDDGTREFFQQEAAAAGPELRQARSEPARPDRALTVGPHQPRRIEPLRWARWQAPPRVKARSTVVAKMVIAPVSGPVTLKTDATLQRGDAVMTEGGIRIFTGAMAFPHRDRDFVALSAVGGLSRTVARTLLAMDSLPRG